MQKIKVCNGRLGRWSLLLQAYSFNIQHCASDKNPADFLSRPTHPNSESEHSTELSDHLYAISSNNEYTEVTVIYNVEKEDSVISSIHSGAQINDITFPDLSTEQQKCDDFKDIIKYKQSGQVPEDATKARTIVAESYNY